MAHHSLGGFGRYRSHSLGDLESWVEFLLRLRGMHEVLEIPREDCRRLDQFIHPPRHSSYMATIDTY